MPVFFIDIAVNVIKIWTVRVRGHSFGTTRVMGHSFGTTRVRGHSFGTVRVRVTDFISGSDGNACFFMFFFIDIAVNVIQIWTVRYFNNV